MKYCIYVPGHLGDITIFVSALHSLRIDHSSYCFMVDNDSSKSLLHLLLSKGCSLPGNVSIFPSRPDDTYPLIILSHPTVSSRRALVLLMRKSFLVRRPCLKRDIKYLVSINNSPTLCCLFKSALQVSFSYLYSLFTFLLFSLSTRSKPFSSVSCNATDLCHDFEQTYEWLADVSAILSIPYSKQILPSGSNLPFDFLRQPPLKTLPSEYIVVSPYASSSYRVPSVSAILDALPRIPSYSSMSLVLVGYPHDAKSQSLYLQLRQRLHGHNLIDLTSSTSLSDVVSIVTNALVVIASDSFIFHLAVLSGVHALVVAGAGHFSRFVDYNSLVGRFCDCLKLEICSPSPLPHCSNCNWKCPYNYSCVP